MGPIMLDYANSQISLGKKFSIKRPFFGTQRGEMRAEIESRDLFEGAYLLIRGFELKDLTITSSRGRKLVTFILEGERIKIASADYRAGKATANVKMLKHTVDFLKDEMFKKIRTLELKDRIKRGFERTNPTGNERVFVVGNEGFPTGKAGKL